MRINGTLDFGAHPTWAKPLQTWQGPQWGQNTNDVLVEGVQEITYARGGAVRTRTETVWLSPTGSIGGNVAGSPQAVLLLLRQLQELTNNRAYQPVFIEWQSGGGVTVVDSEDGFWIITQIQPNIEEVASGIIPVNITAAYIAPPSPDGFRLALAYAGGELANPFLSSTGEMLLALPISSTALESSGTRVGAEGSIPIIRNPVVSPEWFAPPASIANLYKGQVHVYDTINTGTNAVPTTGGTFVNANWVEVFGIDHAFQGDMVITNGLHLLLVGVTNARLFRGYFWDTTIATPSWTQWGDVITKDTSGNTATLYTYSCDQVGPEEVSWSTISAASSGQLQRHRFRLGRGRYDIRVDFAPLSNSTSVRNSLCIVPVGTLKIAYNNLVGLDYALGEGPGTTDVTYGYSAYYQVSGLNAILGFLYLTTPGGGELAGVGPNAEVSDTTLLAQNTFRSYGIYVTPYGVNASYSTANLQAEGESGSLGTGWSNVVDAPASAGHTAKAASGTASGNSDTFGSAAQLLAGTYDVYFRVRVTSAAGTTPEMQLGIWDATSSAFLASQTLRAKDVSTSYVDFHVVINVSNVAVSGHNLQFRATTAATLGTDWFIDEAFIALRTSNDGRGPQDIFQQFVVDQSKRWAV